jgi:hypothetical protein
VRNCASGGTKARASRNRPKSTNKTTWECTMLVLVPDVDLLPLACTTLVLCLGILSKTRGHKKKIGSFQTQHSFGVTIFTFGFRLFFYPAANKLLL